MSGHCDGVGGEGRGVTADATENSLARGRKKSVLVLGAGGGGHDLLMVCVVVLLLFTFYTIGASMALVWIGQAPGGLQQPPNITCSRFTPTSVGNKTLAHSNGGDNDDNRDTVWHPWSTALFQLYVGPYRLFGSSWKYVVPVFCGLGVLLFLSTLTLLPWLHIRQGPPSAPLTITFYSYVILYTIFLLAGIMQTVIYLTYILQDGDRWGRQRNTCDQWQLVILITHWAGLMILIHTLCVIMRCVQNATVMWKQEEEAERAAEACDNNTSYHTFPDPPTRFIFM